MTVETSLARLRELAWCVGRLSAPRWTDPHRFHEEKSELAHELKTVAAEIEETWRARTKPATATAVKTSSSPRRQRVDRITGATGAQVVVVRR